MNKELKARWVEALRSGDYKQGRDYLCMDNKYCCIGVLCELENMLLPVNGLSTAPTKSNNYSMPSNQELYTLGLAVSVASDLTAKNDSGNWSFEDISGFIEGNIYAD